MTQPKSELSTIAAVAQLLAVVLTVAALYFARDVFIPLALGLLLSFLLSPFVNRLQRAGVSNVLAVVATAALAFVFLAGVFTMLGRELTTLVSDLPQHKDELVAKARSFAGMTNGVGGKLDKLADEVTEAMEDEAAAKAELEEEFTVLQRWTDTVFPSSNEAADAKPHDGSTPKTPLYTTQVSEDLPLASWASTAGTVLGPLATAGLVSVFALFMLIHREDLRDRIIAVVSHGDYVTTTEALNEAAQRISRYLIAQTIVNSSYGFVLSVGLAIIGGTMTEAGNFPNAVLWGVLAACLRFVPYLGPIAAAIFPLAIALSVFPGYNIFVAVLALIVTMELLSNNVLEPWLYGTSTGISAVAVIVAAVFWGWLWGPVGVLLSTPLTVCLVVLGRYVPRFKILATLLGEEVKIKASMRFYQRLLANDKHRASDILAANAKESGFKGACDEVLIPALKRIRSDHDGERLTEEDADRLYDLVNELAGDPSWHSSVEPPPEEVAEPAEAMALPKVIGCPSHHFSEAIVLELLRVAARSTWEQETLEADMLPQELGQRVAEENPAVVVIIVLPKGGVAQARYLCKSIRSNGYRGGVVIACLGKFKNFDKLFVKFRKAGATSMTTTYSQTAAKINSLVRHADRAIETRSSKAQRNSDTLLPT